MSSEEINGRTIDKCHSQYLSLSILSSGELEFVFHVLPYKSLRDKIHPRRKMDQGQPLWSI